MVDYRPCSCKLMSTCMAKPPGLGYDPVYPHNCCATLCEAIYGRVVNKVILPTAVGLTMISQLPDKVLAGVRPHFGGGVRLLPRNVPLRDLDEYVSNISGQLKRRKYQAAREYITRFKYHKSWMNMRMFVKPDGVDYTMKVKGPPRAITYRDPRGALLLAGVALGLESVFYNTEAGDLLPNRGPVFGKGRDSFDKARLILSNLEGFHRPCVLSVDASRFDRHISEALMRVKFEVMGAMTTAAGQRILAMILEDYLRPGSIRSSQGVVLRDAPVALRSGDMDTALGNNLVSWMIHVAFNQFLTGKWDAETMSLVEAAVGESPHLAPHNGAAIIDGDDVLLVFEHDVVPSVCSLLTPFFRQLGIDMRLDAMTCEVPEISWCQQQIIQIAPGVNRLVRHPRKVVSSALSGPAWTCGPKGRKARALAVGSCELVLNVGVPVLESFALALVREGQGGVAADIYGESPAYRARMEKKVRAEEVCYTRYAGVAITPQARVSFYAAFGMHPDVQMELEQLWAGWKLDHTSHSVMFDQSAWAKSMAHVCN